MGRTKRTKKRGFGRAGQSQIVSKIVSIEKAITPQMMVTPDKLSNPEGFTYSSTAVVQARALTPRPPKQPKKEGLTPAEYVAAREAYEVAKDDYARSMRGGGCMMPRRVRTVKGGKHAGTQVVTYTKPTGERCKGAITWDDDGTPRCSTPTFRDPRCFPSVYTPGSSPCATPRFASKGSCPVQLTWLEGKPVLRLCAGQGTPGPLLRVTSPKDAMELATALCTEWSANGRSWSGVAMPTSRDMGVGGLGRAKKRKTRKKASR